jgi:hypothetical protein
MVQQSQQAWCAHHVKCSFAGRGRRKQPHQVAATMGNRCLLCCLLHSLTPSAAVACEPAVASKYALLHTARIR